MIYFLRFSLMVMDGFLSLSLLSFSLIFFIFWICSSQSSTYFSSSVILALASAMGISYLTCSFSLGSWSIYALRVSISSCFSFTSFRRSVIAAFILLELSLNFVIYLDAEKIYFFSDVASWSCPAKSSSTSFRMSQAISCDSWSNWKRSSSC